MSNDSEVGDLRSARNAIEGQVAKNTTRGSVGKVVLAGCLVAVVGFGGFYAANLLSKPNDPKVSIPVSGVSDYPEDRTATDTLDLPRSPDPVFVDRPVIQTQVDTATLARLKELEDDLAAARELIEDRTSETEAERELRLSLERDRDRFAADIAALRSTAENDQARARELQRQLQASLSAAERAANTARTQSETDRIRAKTEADRKAAERELEFQRQLTEARRIDPFEQERLRIEEERLRAEQARLEELAKTRAERRAAETARINSSMLAINNTGADEAGAADARELSANEAFVRRTVAPVPVSRASQITNPQATIPQGVLVQASLETAIDSTLPGAIRGVVSEDVHSIDGSAVLVPAGSKVFGEYSSDIALGQRRVLIVWTRILTPSNRSISIASYGADRLGRSGTSGTVNTRFGTKFAGAAAISIIGAGPAILAGQTDSEATANAIEDVGQDLSTATSSAIGAYLSIPPTIYVKQGAMVTIVVDRDLEVF